MENQGRANGPEMSEGEALSVRLIGGLNANGYGYQA